MFRPIFHILLHLIVPGLAARLGYPRAWQTPWKRAWLIMLATMAVDLDHLLSDPIYVPDRCSIGHHPLHTWPAILLYFALAAHPRTRLIGVGLLIHMALDTLDCAWMTFL